jgi:hypothetical protein
MIKVFFECINCKCQEGRVMAWDRDVIVECTNPDCNMWEQLVDLQGEPNTENHDQLIKMEQK